MKKTPKSGPRAKCRSTPKSTNRPPIDLELLKHWKGISTKAKLQWLEDALRFGKLRKF